MEIKDFLKIFPYKYDFEKNFPTKKKKRLDKFIINAVLLPFQIWHNRDVFSALIPFFKTSYNPGCDNTGETSSALSTNT